VYQLKVIDGTPTEEQLLVFVKREGPKFPGNVGSHPGTNIQEVLRAVLERLSYLDKQEHDDRNTLVAGYIGYAIYYLEERAANRHGRTPPNKLEAVIGEVCLKCGHVGCQETCRK
jgi:hypothetical protein